MPAGAPGLMNLPQLQFAKAPESQNTAQSMQDLGQNLKKASTGLQNYLNPTQPPGADQTGMAGSPYAGPVAPPVAAPGGPGMAAAPGGPGMAAPASGPFPAVPFNPTPQFGQTPLTGILPTPPVPYPNAGQQNSPVGQWAQQNPLSLMQFLKNGISGGGGAPQLSGNALLNGGGAGMLQGPLANNPMLTYPGAGG